MITWESSGSQRRSSGRSPPTRVSGAIPVRRLASLTVSPADADVSKIYAVQLELKDWLKNKEGKAFDREEYRQHPDRFESSFAKDVSRSLLSNQSDLTL